MKLSLVQWLDIERKHDAVIKAILELEHTLSLTAIEQSKAGNKEEVKLLLDYAELVGDAETEINRFMPGCESEWMGGPTSGPGSEHTKTYIREPWIASGKLGKAARHFTADEVQEAKDKGLLLGGPDLTGPKEIT